MVEVLGSKRFFEEVKSSCTEEELSSSLVAGDYIREVEFVVGEMN